MMERTSTNVLTALLFFTFFIPITYAQGESQVTHYPNKYFTAEYSDSGVKITKHIYDDRGNLIATVEGNGPEAKTYYVHTDHLGGTNVVTDEQGQITEVTDYLPYGQINTNYSPAGFSEKRKFTSHIYDPESDLNFMNARYQDGNIGRFLSQDPSSRDNPEKFLVDPQQFNFYSYGRNNPIRFYDPNGEDVQDVLVSAAVTTAGNVFRTIDGTVNAAFHPIQTTKGIPQLPSVVKQEAQQAYSDITSGNDYDRTAGIINSVFLVGSLIAPEARLGSASRFITNVSIDDLGKITKGTVDLKPTLDRVESGQLLERFRNDGTEFENRTLRNGDRLLPQKDRGYYKEYVHPTPWIRDRQGPQRLIIGKNGEVYYSPNHYKSVIRVNYED